MKTGFLQKISLYSAILIAILLILAAFAKWLYPHPQPFHIEKIAISVDLLAALLLLIFHRRVGIWILLSLLASVWLGYSFFWLLQRAPCGCFGAFEGVPAGVALGLDLSVIALSWMNMVCLEGGKRTILLTIFCALLFAISGFWLGSAIFYFSPRLGLSQPLVVSRA